MIASAMSGAAMANLPVDSDDFVRSQLIFTKEGVAWL
jgi:hypothetical protein